MEFKIEKGVPHTQNHHKQKYPFRDMEVGDSFFTPSKVNQLSYYSARLRIKLSQKQEGSGFRVWRVA